MCCTSIWERRVRILPALLDGIPLRYVYSSAAAGKPFGRSSRRGEGLGPPSRSTFRRNSPPALIGAAAFHAGEDATGRPSHHLLFREGTIPCDADGAGRADACATSPTFGSRRRNGHSRQTNGRRPLMHWL